tara:strand:+ start:887 stop:1327 length:441 start_codon:yes stop_codon:yes gene_type:complete
MKNRDDDEPGAEIVGNKVVVRDLATTVQLKKVTAKNERLIRREEARARRMEAKLELAKMKVNMNAREAASKHLATFAGLYMTVMVMSFLVSVKYLDAELVAVVAGLITLVVTSISALLRSIVVEAPENGHTEQTPPAKPPPGAYKL